MQINKYFSFLLILATIDPLELLVIFTLSDEECNPGVTSLLQHVLQSSVLLDSLPFSSVVVHLVVQLNDTGNSHGNKYTWKCVSTIMVR